MLSGTVIGEKAAPGICSILISACSMLGGIFMDVDAIDGVLQDVCHALPFYYSVQAVRMANLGEYSQIGKSLVITIVYAVVIYLLAVWAMQSKMQKDVK